VWPRFQIFVCLWHIQKAWAKNVMKKIIGQETRCETLKDLGNIIYNKDSLVGVDLNYPNLVLVKFK